MGNQSDKKTHAKWIKNDGPKANSHICQYETLYNVTRFVYLTLRKSGNSIFSVEIQFSTYIG